MGSSASKTTELKNPQMAKPEKWSHLKENADFVICFIICHYLPLKLQIRQPFSHIGHY
jgi:hypothetical protein